ncbi:hypothetical protein [Catalinimonas niigatensis]|uniref:hypothetical protein n=1 Tax=Catalinimonas niigatensis TaxID=1397264 RepID=UPI002664EDA1|nr:hypothetical protein [Catalinimonas niigatensis]WPP50898.1 hypothetical protein PZB72_00635 [Catalinimonas niigatensis]
MPVIKLYTFRFLITLLMLFGLFIPFILQETFYPFFRFGMFAEPVKRSIQTEQFFLVAYQNEGGFDFQIAELTGIQRSKLDYLLRNYYYRNEADQFLKQVSRLFPSHQMPDTLYILRKIQNDTSLVARFPRE